jgi:hypothetical protein
MRKNPSGWQLRSQRKPLEEDPICPSGFDLLLNGLGITEKEAAQNAAVRLWVFANYRTRFVPERVLEAVGVREVLL